MSGQGLTVRQQIVESITGTLLSARRLAGLLEIREREIEDHLPHVVKSIARDRTKRFVIDPSKCLDCGFVYRDRTRLTQGILSWLSIYRLRWCYKSLWQLHILLELKGYRCHFALI